MVDCIGQGVCLEDDLPGELGQALSGCTDGRSRDRDRGDHGSHETRAPGPQSSTGPRRAPPTSSRSRHDRTCFELGEQVTQVGDRARRELREAAERWLSGSERHEDLPHRRRVNRDSAADPVTGAERVIAVDLGDTRDATRRRDRDVRRFARSIWPSRSRNGQARAARSPTLESRRAYSTSTGPGRKPATAAALGEAVSLEGTQQASGCRFGEPRVLHDARQRHDVVALDEADENPRGPVDRLGSVFDDRSAAFAIGAVLWHQ